MKKVNALLPKTTMPKKPKKAKIKAAKPIKTKKPKKIASVEEMMNDGKKNMMMF